MLHHIARRALVAVLFLPLAAGCGLVGETVDPVEDAKSQTTKTELEVIEVQAGTGAEARSGRRIAVHYTGWLYHPDKPDHHGRQFDSSRTRGEPLEFTVDGSVPFAVIPGWNQGVAGMKVGGRRTLVIPPALAYGRQGSPPTIPGNATLVFDVELVAVK